VIGYPALESLGNLTFLPGGGLIFNSPKVPRSDPGARMFLDGYTPIVAVTDGSTFRLCSFDSGAMNTVLYSPYEQAHMAEFANQSTVSIPISGVGGLRSVPAYLPDRTTFLFGSTTVTLGKLAVLTESHTGDPELFYGNLGQDVIQACTSCTLDFRAMRFSVTTAQ